MNAAGPSSLPHQNGFTGPPRDTPSPAPQPPILIALFGGTGVGKSTFANNASGGNLRVGHDLHSCTKEVGSSPVFTLDGRRVVLIDTPGFDDDQVSDVATLKQIAAFLAETYGVGQKLTGIIYLHRIVDNRMGGASARTFNLFRRMCGTDTLRNVVITTNMWSNPPTEAEQNREEQLRTDFFRPALEGRARLVRRASPGQESAHDVIRLLLGQEPRVAKIQVEMVDQHKDLGKTEAGQELEMQLVDRVNRQQQEINEARQEIQDAIRQRDQQQAALLESEAREQEQVMNQMRQQIQSLQAGLEEERRRYRERLREEQRAFDQEQEKARKRNGIGRRIKNFFRGAQATQAH